MSHEPIQSLPPPLETKVCSAEELVCEDRPEFHHDYEAQVCTEEVVAIVEYRESARGLPEPIRVDAKREKIALEIQARRFQPAAERPAREEAPLREPSIFIAEEEEEEFFEEPEPFFEVDEEEGEEEVVVQALNIEHLPVEDEIDVPAAAGEIASEEVIEGPTSFAIVPLPFFDEVGFFVFQGNGPLSFAAISFDDIDPDVAPSERERFLTEGVFVPSVKERPIIGASILYSDEGRILVRVSNEGTPLEREQNLTFSLPVVVATADIVDENFNASSRGEGGASSKISEVQVWTPLIISERIYSKTDNQPLDAFPVVASSNRSEVAAFSLFNVVLDPTTDASLPIVILHPALLPQLREERSFGVLTGRQKGSDGVLAERVVRGGEAGSENFGNPNQENGSGRQRKGRDPYSMA